MIIINCLERYFEKVMMSIADLGTISIDQCVSALACRSAYACGAISELKVWHRKGRVMAHFRLSTLCRGSLHPRQKSHHKAVSCSSFGRHRRFKKGRSTEDEWAPCIGPKTTSVSRDL